MTKHSLTIFFPCYNEEANIERVTRQAVEVAASITDDYEVIIVDDGSRDRTAELADALRDADPAHIKVIHHKPNRGYGGALISGFTNAGKELVFYTDGDGQFDMHELPAMMPLIENYDIVSGYRMNRQDPFMRKVNAFCWGLLVNTLFRLWLKDIDGAFKLYRREIFDHMTLESQGALIDTEVLAKAKRLGYRVTQYGVHHYPRTAGQQTGANFKVILKAFKELFKLYGKIRKGGK